LKLINVGGCGIHSIGKFNWFVSKVKAIVAV